MCGVQLNLLRVSDSTNSHWCVLKLEIGNGFIKTESVGR